MDWPTIGDSIRETMATRLFDVAEKTITLGAVAAFVILLVGSVITSKIFRRGIDRWMRRSPVYSQKSSLVIQRLTHYAVLLAGFVAAMQAIGIDLSTLFAAGAVFAVGIGFAMQNVAQNFVSGVILMVERSIKADDILMIENQMVKVVSMGIRSTIVRTRDEEEMIVPNSILAQGLVKNFTLTDNLHLIKAEVGVVYGSDMSKVLEVLEFTAKKVPWRVKEEDPRIQMRQFGSSSVDFAVFVWTDEPWISRRLISDLNERIWFALKEAEITIAFPQLDVHFDPPLPEAPSKTGQGHILDNK